MNTDKPKTKNLSAKQYGLVNFISTHQLFEDQLEGVAQTTLGSALKREYLEKQVLVRNGRKRIRIILSDAGYEALHSYRDAAIPERAVIKPLSETVTTLLASLVLNRAATKAA